MSLDAKETIIWIKMVFPTILEPPPTASLHRGGGISELDPRRGNMLKEKIGPERATVMRTSGPIFVLGGDYTAGARSGLRGYSIFKKRESVPKAARGVLSCEQTAKAWGGA